MLTNCEISATNRLAEIASILDRLSDAEFDRLAEASSDYDMGFITMATMNRLAASYNLTGADVVVYMASLLV